MTKFKTREQLLALPSGEFITYLGRDAHRWAWAYAALNADEQVDRGNLAGWFTNAIETTIDHVEHEARQRENQLERRAAQWQGACIGIVLALACYALVVLL